MAGVCAISEFGTEGNEGNEVGKRGQATNRGRSGPWGTSGCGLAPWRLTSESQTDTVERFQGGERMVILVSATESDGGYLLASSEFLLDPRRLTVALSRAKRKMILVASRTIFELFSPDEEVFLNSQLWKNLLLRTCTTRLWEGERAGTRVMAWGARMNDLPTAG